MKRYLLIHLSLLVAFFILVTLVKGWLNLTYLPFWIGGVIGFLLPDLDYAIYHYFLRTSQTPSVNTVVTDVTNQNVFKNWAAAASGEQDKQSLPLHGKKLIFHTVLFQLIFIALTFFVLTSSNSLLGRGIVLAFSLHLFVDLVIDWRYKGTIDHWFRKSPLELDQRQRQWYVIINGVVLLLFGFLL
jgi:hypothetical protein